ncbi:transcriptional regulator [Salinicoccus sediminis]|uniref:Transcriptional regulator n=1 Tax=Salinicoccus sediminis TaxID=1432562 RepID=A0A0M2SJ94_9STAP|nr:transcriptional regulator [Salinicoccus sediminis]KKK34774.1 transcriptional regulator [Salinicoccus sediminis]
MKLGRNDIPKLEEYWINHSELKKQLQFRRFELLYYQPDTNVGGGKSNIPTAPTEQEAIKLTQDELYNNLKRITESIDKVYHNLDDDSKFIIHARYFDTNVDCYEWEDIAHELTKMRQDDRVVSRNAVLRKRNKIMEDTAVRIGWVSVQAMLTS